MAGATGFGSFLVALAGPVAKRALIALGFGTLSYAAVAVVLNQALTAAKGAWSGLAGDTLSLIAMAGVPTAASIIAGALVTRIALQFTKQIGLVK